MGPQWISAVVELQAIAPKTLFLPVAFAFRSTWTYRRLILGGGSAVIAATASVWLAQRAFDVTLSAHSRRAERVRCTASAGTWMRAL